MTSPKGRRVTGRDFMTRLLTLRDLMQMTALSRSAVYALMAASRFPKPIRIGNRAVRVRDPVPVEARSRMPIG